ncbi:hypothetical protein H072_5143 [Dactylellina haptotyla CBS 200.50]|uniref:Uncharacterized protein n=1 Tax=Dactylellina haptotyla (strain CBS 200.50) TaxID=1284197 RepID=S8AIK3_DACHA|nr:hypothetical protein H072_5143 [Dactylellina haptotyla CBS 200.50]
MANPPPPLIVDEIAATPAFSVATTDPNELVTAAGSDIQLFDLTNPKKFVDNSQTEPSSLRPVAFLLPVGSKKPELIKFSLRLTLTFTAPPEWAASPNGQFIVSAVLLDRPTGNPLKPVLQSSQMPVTRANGKWTVDEMQLYMPRAMLGEGGVLPFVWKGPFIWSLSMVGNPAQTTLSTIPTVLELYFTTCPAPKGNDGSQGESILLTQPFYNGIYPVVLLRLFFLFPDQFPDGPLRQEELNSVYCKRMVQTVWDLGNPHLDGGLQFDNKFGKSSFGIGALGGIFNLTDWVARRYKTWNFFDLCALIQLGSSLLLTQDGAERLSSEWVLQDTPTLIAPGQLYGLSASDETPCNNPFWDTPNQLGPSTPLADPASSQRTGFHRHTWLEVLMYNPDEYRGVLDCSIKSSSSDTNNDSLDDDLQGGDEFDSSSELCRSNLLTDSPDINPTLDSGSRNREEYLLHRLDKTRAENKIIRLGPNVWTVPVTGYSFCKTTPIDGSKLKLTAKHLDSSESRPYTVGVLGTDITYPIEPYLPGNDSVLGIGSAQLPPALKLEIEFLLKVGDSRIDTNARRNTIVDADVDVDTILGIVRTIARDASSGSFSRAAYGNMDKWTMDFKSTDGDLSLTIQAFRAHSVAKAKLVQYLTYFQVGPLDWYIKPLPSIAQGLGHIALCTDTDILLVRGNLFITLTSTAQLATKHFEIMVKLDDHLRLNTTGTVTAFQSLHMGKVIKLNSGQKCQIHVSKGASEVYSPLALIKDPTDGDLSVVQIKACDDQGQYTFYTRGTGQLEIALTVGVDKKPLVRSISHPVSVQS